MPEIFIIFSVEVMSDVQDQLHFMEKKKYWCNESNLPSSQRQLWIASDFANFATIMAKKAKQQANLVHSVSPSSHAYLRVNFLYQAAVLLNEQSEYFIP